MNKHKDRNLFEIPPKDRNLFEIPPKEFRALIPCSARAHSISKASLRSAFAVALPMRIPVSSLVSLMVLSYGIAYRMQHCYEYTINPCILRTLRASVLHSVLLQCHNGEHRETDELTAVMLQRKEVQMQNLNSMNSTSRSTSESSTMMWAILVIPKPIADTNANIRDTYKKVRHTARIVKHGFSVEYWHAPFSNNVLFSNMCIIVRHETTYSQIMHNLPF